MEVPLTNSLLSTIWTIPTPPSLVTPTNVMRVGCVLFQGTDEDIRQHRARDKRAPLVTGTEWITNDCPLNLMILTVFTPHAARLSRLEHPNLNTKLLLWGDHVKRLTKIQQRTSTALPLIHRSTHSSSQRVIRLVRHDLSLLN